MHMRHWWVGIKSIVVLASGTWTYAGAAEGQDWGPWGMHMMWGNWGLGMMVMMGMVWAALLVAVVFLIRWLITASSPGRHVIAAHQPESALDILNKRYARGEISKQEFEDIRRDIRAGT